MIVYAAHPLKIVWSKQLQSLAHIADIYRLLVLLKFGGVYLDNDILLLKSHRKFFNTSKPIIAEESAVSLANGFIIAPDQSVFLLRWLLEYSAL